MEPPFHDDETPIGEALDHVSDIKNSVETTELVAIETRDIMRRIEYGIGIIILLIAYAVWIFGNALGVDLLPG